MPINASVEYTIAERDYLDAVTHEEKLKCLQIMLQLAPSHKGTQKLRDQIKKRIKTEKEFIIKAKKASKKKSVTIKKEGAAQVVFVGLPSSGKSYILSKLSGTDVEQSEVPFSTKMPVVRMINIGGALIQGIEIPSLYNGFHESTKGRELFSTIRSSDLVIVVMDGRKDTELRMKIIFDEFSKAEIELTKQRKYRKDFITFVPAIVLINHQLNLKGRVGNLDIIHFRNIEDVKKEIWNHLGLIRVYTKKEKVAEKPVVLKQGSTIKDLANIVHKDFVANFKSAKVWGDSAKFPGQLTGLDHVLVDKDIIELYTK